MNEPHFLPATATASERLSKLRRKLAIALSPGTGSLGGAPYDCVVGPITGAAKPSNLEILDALYQALADMFDQIVAVTDSRRVNVTVSNFRIYMHNMTAALKHFEMSYKQAAVRAHVPFPYLPFGRFMRCSWKPCRCCSSCATCTSGRMPR